MEKVADQVNVPEHPINETLRELLKEGKKVQAVKEARQVLGLSLLEANQYVDGLSSDRKERDLFRKKDAL